MTDDENKLCNLIKDPPDHTECVDCRNFLNRFLLNLEMESLEINGNNPHKKVVETE